MEHLGALIRLSADLDQRDPDTVARQTKSRGYPYDAFLNLTGIELVGMAVIDAVRKHDTHVLFDEAMVMGALSLSGHRAPLSSLRGKRGAEYVLGALECFTTRLVMLPDYMRERLLNAYLLPYAREHTLFPPAHQQRIQNLIRLHLNEVWIFDLIRRLDRVFQGFNELERNGDQLILAVTLHEHHGKILEHVRTFKGVGKELYTAELRASAEKIIERHPV